LYDGLLRTILPSGVKFLAFADDVALVAEARDSIQLEQLLTISANRVKAWLAKAGLQLALQKCEAMIITNTRTNNDMRINIDGHLVSTCKSLKYLGLQLDSKWSFSAYAIAVAEKAGKVVQNLARKMPNISTAKSRKRKLLSNVAHSILLYPTWSQDMSKTGWTSLLRIQRRICLRVASAYCTVSSDAVGVTACIPPLELMANERRNIYEFRGNPSTQHTKDTLIAWQNRWNGSSKGRWTYSLIGDLDKWVKRKHGVIDFHLTQALSGHGCFSAHLKRFGKLNSSECWYCGHPVDDAKHTIFVCDAWESKRSRVNTLYATTITPSNFANYMLQSEEFWTIGATFINEVLRKKEEEERRRQKKKTNLCVLLVKIKIIVGRRPKQGG